MTDRNDGTRGEQGAAFILGQAGYFIVDGPSGAGGHAANAHGPDGLAFNPQNGDLILYDVKDFLAKRNGSLINRNVSKATALVENLDEGWFDQMIARVEATTDMPSRVLVASRLRACRAALTTGRNWPANTRVAVMRMGGGAVGISARLQAQNITFIDLDTDPIVAAARQSVRKAFKDVADLIDSVRRQIDMNEAEHLSQIKLISTLDTSSLEGLKKTAIGFAGFATNALFNTQPPPLTIWTEGRNALSAARRALERRDLANATAWATIGRFHMLLALKRFTFWKDGLFGANGQMGAGTKMQIAIGVTAVAIVLVFVTAALAAPLVADALAGGGATAGAGAGAGADATAAANLAASRAALVRVAAAAAAAEQKFRIAETAIEVLEREVEVIERAAEPLLR